MDDLTGSKRALQLLAEEPDPTTDFEGCAMCRWVDGFASPEWIADTEHAAVVLCLDAVREGHLLVVAKDHVESAPELGWTAYADLQRLVFEGHQALSRALAPKRIYATCLADPTINVRNRTHYHAHVIPVFGRDTADLSVLLSDSRVPHEYTLEEADNLRHRLRRAWPRRF